jgi:hypothetical protein
MDQQAPPEQNKLKPNAIFIEPAVHRRLKNHVVNNGGTMQADAERAVEDWLGKQEQAA